MTEPEYQCKMLMHLDYERNLRKRIFQREKQTNTMRVTAEIETYFLSFLLTQDVRSNVPIDDSQRGIMKVEVSRKMQLWQHRPEFIEKLRRAYQEVGSDNGAWFFGQLAEAYMKWLSTTPTKAKTE